MDYIKILGLAAAVLTTASNIPQAFKIIKTKTTKGISSLSYGMLFTGGIVWIIYGIYRDDLPIILANGISAVLCGIIWIIRLTAKHTDNDFEA
ncbi:MAG TPA: SemiSWEET transporter [Flavobacterium sp.]|nr:SemiSWEET transporter [Flavobacterium sp.]